MPSCAFVPASEIVTASVKYNKATQTIMKKIEKKLSIIAVIGLTSGLGTSFAGTFEIPVLDPDEILVGEGGKVTLSEYQTSTILEDGSASNDVGYSVNVTDGTEIAGFAVSHNYAGAETAVDFAADWISFTLSASGWADKDFSSALGDIEPTRAEPIRDDLIIIEGSFDDVGGFDFVILESWESTLGAVVDNAPFGETFGEDGHISVYISSNGTTLLTETNDMDDDYFEGSSIADFPFQRNNGFTNSEFVAFGSNGSLIDASLPGVIPEPSTALYIVVCSLGLLRRRRFES